MAASVQDRDFAIHSPNSKPVAVVVLIGFIVDEHDMPASTNINSVSPWQMVVHWGC